MKVKVLAQANRAIRYTCHATDKPDRGVIVVITTRAPGGAETVLPGFWVSPSGADALWKAMQRMLVLSAGETSATLH